MIHRDIKPANLWLEEGTGRVKILDFGLARTADDEGHLTQQGAILGTPAYMAPEQAGGKTDHRADLFSLGCVIYRMATGEQPFKGTDAISMLMAVAADAPRPPAAINPRIPPALSELILRLLAKKPEQRPASAQAVVEAIRVIEAAPKGKGKPGPVAVVPGRSGPQRPGVVSSRPKSTTTPPARRRTAAPPPQRGGGVVVFGLLALLLLAGLGVGGYFLWPHTPFNSSASPSSNSALSSPPVVDETEWQPLFDGESLKGWTPVNKKEENNWGAEHGLLYTRGLDKSWLMTEKQYGDFEVHLDYRATVKANSGVALRARWSGIRLTREWRSRFSTTPSRRGTARSKSRRWTPWVRSGTWRRRTGRPRSRRASGTTSTSARTAAESWSGSTGRASWTTTSTST